MNKPYKLYFPIKSDTVNFTNYIKIYVYVYTCK